MSLLTTISDTNKVQSNSPIVKYSASPVTNVVNGVSYVVAWELTRTSAYNFSYLGLTRSAAETNAASLQQQFTRKYMRFECDIVENEKDPLKPNVIISPVFAWECSTSVEPHQSAGDAWQIDVSVNDTDTVFTTEQVTDAADLEGLFQAAAARDTPAGTDHIEITTATWDSSSERIKIEYSASITNFSTSNLSAEIWDPDNSVWVATPLVNRGTVGKAQLADIDENKKFRLVYGSGSSAIYSPAYKTTDSEALTANIRTARYSVVADGSKQYARFVFECTCDLDPRVCTLNVYNPSTGITSTFPLGSAGVSSEFFNGIGNVYTITVTSLTAVWMPSTGVKLTMTNANSTAHQQLGTLKSNEYTLLPSNFLNLETATVNTSTRQISCVLATDLDDSVVVDKGYSAYGYFKRLDSSSKAVTNERMQRTLTVVSTTKADGKWTVVVQPTEGTVGDSDYYFLGDLFFEITRDDGYAFVTFPSHVTWPEYKTSTSTFTFDIPSTASSTVDRTFRIFGNTTIAAGEGVLNWTGSSEPVISDTPTPRDIVFASTGAKKVTLAGYITKLSAVWIERAADAECAKYLTSITLGSTVEEIGVNSLSDLIAVKTISASGLKTIGSMSFMGSSILETVYIPLAASIGSDTFKNCPLLDTVTITGKTTQEVAAMTNYPWGAHSGTKFHCSNGDLTVA